MYMCQKFKSELRRATDPATCEVWVEYIPPEVFDIEQLDPAVLSQFFGVGFTLVATVLIIGISASAVVDFIKRA